MLLPTAERAVAALAQLQDGFFLGRGSAGTAVTLSCSDGSTSQLRIETATAQYRGAARNGIHGFGARKGNIQQISALVVHHNGNIAADLALLSYLYLPDCSPIPTWFAGTLHRNGKPTRKARSTRRRQHNSLIG